MSTCRTPAAHARRAFTLIELIVTIVILGVLAAIAVVAFGALAQRAQTATALANLRTVTTTALQQATLERASELDRDRVTAAMQATGATVVSELSAATWELAGTDASPSGTGHFAVGFARGNGAPQDDGGERAALVVSAGGVLLGQLVDVAAGSTAPPGPVPDGTTPTDLLKDPTLIDTPDEPEAAPAPGPQDVLAVPGPADGTVTVSWSQTEGATSYTVVAAAAGAAPGTCATDAATCLIEGLTAGRQYTVSVVAHYSDTRTGAASPVVVDLAPGRPDVSLGQTTTTTANFTWTDPAGATSYQFHYRVDGGPWTGADNVAGAIKDVGAARGTLLGPVMAGSRLEIQVRAVGPGGTSDWSPTVQAQLAPEVPVVNVGTITTTTATFSWPAAPHASTTFQSQYRLDGGPWIGSGGIVGSVMAHGAARTVTHGPTTPGSLIEIQVRAGGPGGTTAWSPVAKAQLKLDAPTGLHEYLMNGRTATYRWNPVPGATSYVLSVNGVQQPATTGTTASYFAAAGPHSTVTVTASNARTTSPASAPVTLLAPRSTISPGTTLMLTPPLWVDGIPNQNYDRSLVSSTGNYVAYVEDNGSFSVRHATGMGGYTAPAGAGGFITFTHDGNLVLFTSGGQVVASTGTQGQGKMLAMQDDGNLVIYNAAGAPIWALSWESSNPGPGANFMTWVR